MAFENILPRNYGALVSAVPIAPEVSQVNFTIRALRNLTISDHILLRDEVRLGFARHFWTLWTVPLRLLLQNFTGCDTSEFGNNSNTPIEVECEMSFK